MRPSSAAFDFGRPIAFILAGALLSTFPSAAAAQTTTSTAGASTDSAAAGDPTAQAIALFKRAKANYKDGKYVEALIDFKKAYELKPTGAITYNIARCHEQLSEWKEAVAAYELFATETDDQREKTEALDKIEFLKSKLAPADSGEDAKYKVNIDEGKKAYSRGDYERAIDAFQKAFDIKPSPGVLFNIAKSFERMGRYEEAIEYFKQYLVLCQNCADRPDIEEQIKRLLGSIKNRFQELSVSSDPPGADVYLDDRNTGLQGQTNYRFKVKPGPHTLYIDFNGYEAIKRDFVMPDDKPLALEFQMKKLTDVGFAQISVNVDGARLFVDGAIIGLSPYKEPKALKSGDHQITIEARGYPRHTSTFIVQRDATAAVDIVLQEYDEPIKDETLSKWGRNFLLIGLIGGGIGFAVPFGVQEFINRRPGFSALGPTEVVFGDGITAENTKFWRGTKDAAGNPLADGAFNPNFRENKAQKNLETIQLVSIITGSVFVATGLTFYCVKWFRPDPARVEIISSLEDDDDAPLVEITGFGVGATPDGAGVGLVGSF